ncbi:MAG: ATP-dependent Clp protease adaptor ClpS [Bacteroidales bacterium]|nr:ATP-dependent Clp protease adaptor ClpS [Bacteroidales bacterium]
MKEKPVSESKSQKTGDKSTLVLLNDDFNTFDHVIESLVEVCGHDPVQAEQCALITHFRGSCDIRKGSQTIIKSMHIALLDRNLTSEIII